MVRQVDIGLRPRNLFTGLVALFIIIFFGMLFLIQTLNQNTSFETELMVITILVIMVVNAFVFAGRFLFRTIR